MFGTLTLGTKQTKNTKKKTKTIIPVGPISVESKNWIAKSTENATTAPIIPSINSIKIPLAQSDFVLSNES